MSHGTDILVGEAPDKYTKKKKSEIAVSDPHGLKIE